MLKIKHVAVCMLALAMLSAGCTNYSGKTYSCSQVRSAQTVQYGTVVSVQPVTLEEDRPAVLGTVGGGVVGGVLGNMVGGGRGKTLATIAGAALGAAGGYAGEKALTKQNGLEITVELENGQQLSIVQAADQQFSPGERVRVLRGSDGSARVTR
ncbi:glycine zipper 2TM domain-containing protein [Bilophila wadsworthia]